MTCWKRAYKRRRDAERDIGRFRRGKKVSSGSVSLHAYLCPCGYWHLTSKSSQEWFRRDEARP